MDSSAEHTALVAAILAACGSRPDCRLWRNASGMGRALDSDRKIRFGLKGSADIIGLSQRGIFLGIEAKTGDAVQMKHQKTFATMIRKLNGYYLVARSVKDAVEWLDTIAKYGMPCNGLEDCHHCHLLLSEKMRAEIDAMSR